MGAEADTQYTQLTDSHTLDQDLEIIIPSGKVSSYQDVEGAISVRSGDSIIGNSGVLVSIDVVRPAGEGNAVSRGIQAKGGVVSIDKLFIIFGREADRSAPEFKDLRSFGIQTENGGDVTIGDDAKIYSLSDGIALSARRGSSISIGDNATFYGNVSDQTIGTILLYSSDITIGHNATILNDGYSVLGGSSDAESVGYHVAVNTEYRGKITIGNDATISSYADGAQNHAVVTGMTIYDNNTGTVVIGDRAKIIASGG